MNISLIVNYFPPEMGSAADLFYQLALEFQKRGHYVRVFTTETRYYKVGSNSKKESLLKHSLNERTRAGLLWNVEQTYPNFAVYRVRLLPIIYPRSGKKVIFRDLEHIFQPLMFLTLIKHISSSDAILVYSPPLILGFLGSLIGKILNIRTIINVQDIHPQAIVDLGLLKNPFLISVFQHIEKQMYKYSSAITVHSKSNKDVVINHDANPQKVFIVYNTVKIPTNKLLMEGEHFRKRYSLENKFIITYAGNMSFSQDLDTIIFSANILYNKIQNLVFILAGNGPQKHELEFLNKKLKMSNVIFLPYQEGNDYWRMLSASDVCLVSLKKSKVKTPVVPRKLEDIMAAGRPVIANVPLEGDVKKIIEKVNCGLVVEAENPKILADAIQKIHNLPKKTRLQYGCNGRLFAIQNFSPNKIATQYESLFAALY